MKKITLVQMNDSHAYLDLHPELFWEHGKAAYRSAGGYARIATVLNQIRQENPGQVLFLDGGDTFHGTYPAVHTKGHALVPILNALQPDAMTAHWEFAYTPQGFKSLTNELDYPMLAVNVYQKNTVKRFFKPYEVIETAGLRVGVIGIASNIVDKTMPPHFSEGIFFTNGEEELPEIIHTLREEENADLVVLLSHLGFPQDMHLLEKVPGVDVDLSAHTHHRLEQVVRQGSTLVVQSGSHGSYLTRLDLDIDEGQIIDFRHQLIEISADIKPDPEVEALVQTALQPHREELNQIVGETRLALHRGLNLEATMDNFLLSALRHHTGAQIAFSNGWRYGAPVLPGPIRLNDLHNIVPVNPPVSTVEITGEELWAMLEENLNSVFARDPFQQMGGYVKRSLGLRVFFKVENPYPTRIHKIFVDEVEVQPTQRYQAAFITEQGVPAAYGQNRQQHPEKMIAVMQTYLKQTGPFDLGLQGTFTLI
ncbi:MAG: bifunctional metallophosphatase/5'-nucleotidase [Anaerolineaceae bacterium]|jgi:2',3'-cyclic-nucleotide 2'-phosphodiesterase (5'-nucleotidase family)|nr:bifunctional metallophosphatase/5'-nucleotidase [Anaerolineaceae bacterium]